MTFIDPTGNMFAIPGSGIGGLSALERTPAAYVPTVPSIFSSTATGEPNDAQSTWGGGNFFSSTSTGELNDAQLTYGQPQMEGLPVPNISVGPKEATPQRSSYGSSNPTVCPGGVCGTLNSANQAGAILVSLGYIAGGGALLVVSTVLWTYPPAGAVVSSIAAGAIYGGGYALGETALNWNTADAQSANGWGQEGAGEFIGVLQNWGETVEGWF